MAKDKKPLATRMPEAYGGLKDHEKIVFKILRALQPFDLFQIEVNQNGKVWTILHQPKRRQVLHIKETQITLTDVSTKPDTPHEVVL